MNEHDRQILESLKPRLKEPFPSMPAVWTDPITGLKVPKTEIKNIEWRKKLIERADADQGFRADIMAACAESCLFWINAFAWTYHQFEVGADGIRQQPKFSDVPFLTYEIQDDMVNTFEAALNKPEDVLVHKSRDMGASWICTDFLHHKWLFRPDSQLLELSRTESYVDQSGNMKALFQKHDYTNMWLPSWMIPEGCLPGGKYRTKMHLMNCRNGSCIDGESTTKNAASGDRRLIILLDEFAKVDNGAAMRSATRDAALMRIVNSTEASVPTEYTQWRESGQIKVFPLLWWEHPDKGRGRYCVQNPVTGEWKIRSPWYDAEAKVRSAKEMATEIDGNCMEAGQRFLDGGVLDKHTAMFAAAPKAQYTVNFKKSVTEDAVKECLRKRDCSQVEAKRGLGPLAIWASLINNRLDQTKTYYFGIDIGRGQGASNSVISIKCRETGEKVGEWCDANTPPYEMTRVAAALAIWVGGRDGLPFQKWENNGPGWDYGRIMVTRYCYPHYYRMRTIGRATSTPTKSYGWHSSPRAKEELLRAYDRALVHGRFINHSRPALVEAKNYICYPDGGIGPAALVVESANARKTHGDRVIADALTIEDNAKVEPRSETVTPRSTAGFRMEQTKRRLHNAGKRFDFR